LIRQSGKQPQTGIVPVKASAPMDIILQFLFCELNQVEFRLTAPGALNPDAITNNGEA
jgi:hypothetical protein